MASMQACLREEHRLRYPHLKPKHWYEVVPIFPGVTTRRTDLFGHRLTRIQTHRGYETLLAEHFLFRQKSGEERPERVAEGEAVAAGG